MRVAAIVVSLPERLPLLVDALASVRIQTRPVDDTVIGIDPYHYGEVANMNRLIRATDCDWLAFLHDDDLWSPDHIATAERHFDTADVIVSRVTLDGRPQHTIEAQHDNFDDLRRTNWFPPSAVVVRKDVFGEFTDPPQPPPRDWVDWSNWRRLLDAGARFVHTNEATMTYRFGSWGNGSWR
jgi:hypothetical protein